MISIVSETKSDSGVNYSPRPESGLDLGMIRHPVRLCGLGEITCDQVASYGRTRS